MSGKSYLEITEPAELRVWAREELGMNLRHNALLETMRTQIKEHLDAANTGENTAPEKTLTSSPNGSTRPSEPVKGRKDDWPWILIPRDKEDTQPVYVGLNGTGYTIPRGVKLQVPPGVEGILAEAVRRDYDPKTMVPMDTPTYAYQKFAE